MFLIGSNLLYFGNTFTVVCIGRILLGIASGVSTCIVPLYIAEISPSKQKGINGSLVQLSIVVGILISTVLGVPLSNRQSWRQLFAISTIPVLIQIICLPFMPESPLWLVMRNDHDHARVSLEQLYGVDDVDDQLEDIFRQCGVESIGNAQVDMSDDENLQLLSCAKNTVGFHGLWNDKSLWKRFIAAIGLQIIQQCNYNGLFSN